MQPFVVVAGLVFLAIGIVVAVAIIRTKTSPPARDVWLLDLMAECPHWVVYAPQECRYTYEPFLYRKGAQHVRFQPPCEGNIYHPPNKDKLFAELAYVPSVVVRVALSAPQYNEHYGETRDIEVVVFDLKHGRTTSEKLFQEELDGGLKTALVRALYKGTPTFGAIPTEGLGEVSL